jgi:hypothetical protein
VSDWKSEWNFSSKTTVQESQPPEILLVLVILSKSLINMSAKISAGVLMYGHRAGQLEVLLVHPGGPLWRKKDEGAWSIRRANRRKERIC